MQSHATPRMRCVLGRCYVRCNNPSILCALPYQVSACALCRNRGAWPMCRGIPPPPVQASSSMQHLAAHGGLLPQHIHRLHAALQVEAHLRQAHGISPQGACLTCNGIRQGSPDVPILKQNHTAKGRRTSWMRPRWRSTVSSARPVLSGRMHAPAFRSGSVNQWRPLTPSLPCHKRPPRISGPVEASLSRGSDLPCKLNVF